MQVAHQYYIAVKKTMKEILNKKELAEVLGITVKRIDNLFLREQGYRLPPSLPRQKGELRLWSGRAVEMWLDEMARISFEKQPTVVEKQEEKRGRGRPRKVAA